MSVIEALSGLVGPLVALSLVGAIIYAAFLIARGRREQRFWEERFDEVRREARHR